MEPMRAIFLLALAAVRASATRPHQSFHAGGEEKKARTLDEKKTFTFKVMQFNMLADGLAYDGFLTRRKQDEDPEFAKRVALTFKLAQEIKTYAENMTTAFDVSYVSFVNSGGAIADYPQLLDDTAKAKERENEKRLVNWPARSAKIMGIISAVKPDIVVFQELDHYADMAAALAEANYGYTSVKGKGPRDTCKYEENQMQQTRLGALSKLRKEPPKEIDGKPNPKYREEMDVLIPEQREAYKDALKKLTKAGVAFAPNLNSSARKFALAEDWGGIPFKEDPTKDPDDQGVAIFWKANRFDANSVHMSLIGQSSKADSAALMVELTPKPETGTAGPVRVVTTHLSSGPEKERRRHHELEDVRKSFIKGDTPTIFATDMNSDIWFDTTKRKDTKGMKTNCFELVTGDPKEKVKEREQDWETKKPINGSRKLLTRWGMKSIWSAEGLVPASVLKMRGPATNQPDKMGELAFETIDHVFYSGKGLEMVADTAGVVGPMNDERMTKEERPGFISAIITGGKGEYPPRSAVEQVVNMMLPSEDTPSDHFPVVAEFTLS